MAKLRPKTEWEPYRPKQWKRYGMRERYDDKWEVVHGASWWADEDAELLMVVDSRDVAIGFIKLLRGNENERLDERRRDTTQKWACTVLHNWFQ